MAVKSAKEIAIAAAILRDKAEKKRLYDKTAEQERQKVRLIVESSRNSEHGTFSVLGDISPGTRFEAIGAPELRGCTLSSTFGAIRVLLDSGHDTTLSPSTPVLTGAAKAEKKPKVRAKADTPEPEPVKKRPRVFEYTGVRLTYFLGSKGWDFAKVRALFDAFEVPLADSTIQMTLDSVGDPRYFDPAKVTDEHYAAMERAVE